MAVRLINLHTHPLRVDLRGGGVLMLAAGQRSAALREELLYDNSHLSEWERAGWVSRVPARMSEVVADAAAAARPVPMAAKKKAAPAAPPIAVAHKVVAHKAAAHTAPAKRAAAKKSSSKRR